MSWLWGTIYQLQSCMDGLAVGGWKGGQMVSRRVSEWEERQEDIEIPVLIPIIARRKSQLGAGMALAVRSQSPLLRRP